MAADPRPRLYDRIGVGYAAQRVADERVMAQVLDALGEWSTLINVGAGTGNYEPVGGSVVAVEPSPVMIAQRSSEVPVVQARAEALPFPDRSFDTALAMFTLHHWSDRSAGLAELGRVSDRQVILIYDMGVAADAWLYDYFPELRFSSTEINAPGPSDVGAVLDLIETRRMLVPFDCTDGFTAAFWGRPEAYLQPEIQAGMSTLARLSDDVRAAGTERLRRALKDGSWDERHGHLRDQEWYDIGYRLTVSRSR